MILTLISLTGHVEHPDDRVGVGAVCPRGHQTLVPVVVGHRADGEWLLHVKIQLVPLLDQVVVVWSSVVIPGTVVVIADVVGIIIVRTVRTSESFSVNIVNYVSIGLGLMGLVIFYKRKLELHKLSGSWFIQQAGKTKSRGRKTTKVL